MIAIEIVEQLGCGVAKGHHGVAAEGDHVRLNDVDDLRHDAVQENAQSTGLKQKCHFTKNLHHTRHVNAVHKLIELQNQLVN